MDKKSVLIIAPHPDDETLGCGGTILNYQLSGHDVYWLIMTAMSEDLGFTPERIASRDEEISNVSSKYGFKKTFNLKFPTTQLDTLKTSDLVSKMINVFNEVKPTTVYLPFRNDAHSDHQITFDTAFACCKWFRSPTVKEVYAYETISETDFSNPLAGKTFSPNVYEDISKTYEKRKAIMEIYNSELGDFPFPRSHEAIDALATKRGSESGCLKAEAFMLIKLLRN